jgi:hypothetical protein
MTVIAKEIIFTFAILDLLHIPSSFRPKGEILKYYNNQKISLNFVSQNGSYATSLTLSYDNEGVKYNPHS